MGTKKTFKTLTTEQWKSFNAQYPTPTFFAGPAWALALNADNANAVPEPVVFEVNDGPTMLLPLVRMRGNRLGWRIGSGFPLGGYDVIFTLDGAIADGKLLESSLQRLCEYRLDHLELTLWPFLEALKPPQYAVQRYEASVIDLIDGASAAIERMDGRSRRMAGQAERRGVTCIQKTDPQTVDIYYELLLQSAKRWGRAAPTVSKRLLQALVHHGGSDVEIWLAFFENKPVAGIMVLYGSVEVFVWSAAMDADYAVLRPHNILHVTLMRAAEARGMRWYNMGASEGLPGVKKFKDGLGARTIGYDRLTLEKKLFKFYRRLRERKSDVGSAV